MCREAFATVRQALQVPHCVWRNIKLAHGRKRYGNVVDISAIIAIGTVDAAAPLMDRPPAN